MFRVVMFISRGAALAHGGPNCGPVDFQMDGKQIPAMLHIVATLVPTATMIDFNFRAVEEWQDGADQVINAVMAAGREQQRKEAFADTDAVIRILAAMDQARTKAVEQKAAEQKEADDRAEALRVRIGDLHGSALIEAVDSLGGHDGIVLDTHSALLYLKNRVRITRAEVEKERAEAIGQEMRAWAARHGSQHLVRCLHLGIECAAIYRDERLSHEMPGWFHSTLTAGDWPRNPPPYAVEGFMEEQKKDVGDDKCRMVFFSQPQKEKGGRKGRPYAVARDRPDLIDGFYRIVIKWIEPSEGSQD